MIGSPRLYHVGRADVAARQAGGFMILPPSLHFLSVAVEAVKPVFPVGPLLGWLVLGITFFTFGELLRRRRHVIYAQILVTLSGVTIAGACSLIALSFAWEWTRGFVCPASFTLALTMPVRWHAVRAVRELRAYAHEGERGFEPVLHISTINPPLGPDSNHANDNSR